MGLATAIAFVINLLSFFKNATSCAPVTFATGSLSHCVAIEGVTASKARVHLKIAPQPSVSHGLEGIDGRRSLFREVDCVEEICRT